MKLLLDSSVLLAASGSESGASRELFRLAPSAGWSLLATPYIVREVTLNLPRLPQQASLDWAGFRKELQVCEDVVTLDWPAVFPAAKDRPILFSALAWADVLLTLDHNDFETLLGGQFYGLPIMSPGKFLEQEIVAGRIQRPQ
jgi:predicted nucleic acid-binding protein